MMTQSTPPVRQEDDSSIASSAPDELSSGDLAELMSAFTEVTTKLERTHAQLRSEVARLNTELHQANEALQRSRRLAALGEMAAGISHEIRNPLGSIRLYTNMLDEDLAELPEQQQIVQKIGRAVRGLDEIVGDVLTFARELKVQWQACDASGLIDGALELCAAESSSIIVRDDRSSAPIELVCDPILIQQALINVLRNACDANRAGDGAQIVLRVDSCMFDGDTRQVEGVVFSVRDQGDGMPDEIIERMFNPFFTTRATGTGLGLAIVHRIIDAHGGKVEVRNNPDCSGATVELYVPTKQALVVTRGGFEARNGERVVQTQLETAEQMG